MKLRNYFGILSSLFWPLDPALALDLPQALSDISSEKRNEEPGLVATLAEHNA